MSIPAQIRILMLAKLRDSGYKPEPAKVEMF